MTCFLSFCLLTLTEAFTLCASVALWLQLSWIHFSRRILSKILSTVAIVFSFFLHPYVQRGCYPPQNGWWISCHINLCIQFKSVIQLCLPLSRFQCSDLDVHGKLELGESPYFPFSCLAFLNESSYREKGCEMESVFILYFYHYCFIVLSAVWEA